ncbi:hypothetical protein C2W54_27265, partial [Escherichia coli]
YVNAWASLHRVQQFRFFGIPGRQAYRELRLLAGQAARQKGDKKAGAPVLDNPRLDAILAAADAGCPLAENLYQQGKDKSADGDTRTDITRMDDKELHDYLHSMNKKERRELAARLRLVKPKRRRDYKQRITDHQRQQLVYELKSRGFDGSEKEVDLLLRGGSIPSGAGLRIFYRNQRLQEDDKWRNLY